MPDQIQLRGGTAADNNAFTGANREVTVDTTNKTLRVHDGVTSGGSKLAAYDAWGRLQVADPQDDGDVTNKGYVDTQISGSESLVLGRATMGSDISTTSTSYVAATGMDITVTPTRIGAILEVEFSFALEANRTSASTLNRVGHVRLYNETNNTVVQGAEDHQFGYFLISASSTSTPIRAPVVLQGRHIVASLDPIKFRLDWSAWADVTMRIFGSTRATALMTVTEQPE